MKDFVGNFPFTRCHTSSFEVASLGFLSSRYGKFIMKWRLPGADLGGGDPASGSLTFRVRSPKVTHGAALVRIQSPFGLCPYLA